MAAAAKIAALMEQLTAQDVHVMPPAERERSPFRCARFATLPGPGRRRMLRADFAGLQSGRQS